MKKTFRILKHDMKSASKNMIIFIVIIGITILPALYAWFNIAANWDPYGNTKDLPFAVVSEDAGYQYKTIHINAGDSIIDGLQKNKKMGWKFTNAKDAKDGVKEGKYYAAVIIPKDFSENLLSIVSGNFKQAKLEYYVNEKKNAIAPKITDKGVQAIEESIGEAYVDTLGKTLATAMGLVGDELTTKKGEVVDRIVSDLKDTKKDIKVFKKSVNVLIDTLDSIDDLVKSTKDLQPTIEKSLNKAGIFNKDIKSLLTATKGTASQVTGTLDGIIDSGSTYMSDVSGYIDDAFAEIEKNPSKAADKLEKAKIACQQIITVNNKAISILQNMQTELGVNCKDAIKKLQDANKKQEDLISTIDSACDTIRKTGKLPKSTQDKIKSLVSDATQKISSAGSSFVKVKPKLDKVVNDAFTVLDDATEFVNVLKAGPEQIEVALDSALDCTGNLKKALKDLKSFLTTVDKRIDKVIVKVKDVKGDNVIENIIMPIIKDPDALGKFISAPVSYNTHREFALENYGSSMAPFYTSLAIWVGGVVLVAVVNVELSKKEEEELEKPSTTQKFFGRYLSFLILGQIQAIIIALGDLFFLKIQCANKPMFVLTCMISSFVYTLLIYALTITFSVIGKALAVIILVIQIAACGGTFPVEVLPTAYKIISPFLPFRYGVNAMRETVAGMDWGHYWSYVGLLLVFILVALFLGLILRRPCMKIISFFNKNIEDSDLVI